jgi:YD repeat-containing protein
MIQNRNKLTNNQTLGNETTLRLLSRTEQHYNARGQVFRSEQSIIDSKTGEVKRKQESQTWFDAGGRAVKQKYSGRRGINVAEYTPNGQVKRSAQLSESGDILTESRSLYNRRGHTTGNVQKYHKTNHKSFKKAIAKDYGINQEAASRFTKQWCDPFERVIANADYDYIYSDSMPVSDNIPDSSDTIRVYRTNYDSLTGRVLASIDTEDRETRSFVDAAGRMTKTVTNYTGDGVFKLNKPNENITTAMRYDADGNLIWRCDPLGNITKSKYDKLSRLIETILPNGGLTKYNYNFASEVISITDPMGRVTQFEYDSMGHQVKTILPRSDEASDNPVQEIIYNEVGQMEFQIDPLGHALHFEYDEQGRIVRQTDANSSVTIFSYNEEGKLLSLTDSVGNTTRYEYDEFDRVVKETNELDKSRFFEYLPSGLLAEKTDRNKRTTCFKYNRFGQILEEHWLDGKRTINQIYFEYDKNGHLTKVNDTNSSFEYG